MLSGAMAGPTSAPDRAAARLSALPEPQARAELLRCCGSGRWAEAMLALRPFATGAELLNAAERLWWELPAAEWREAFRRHPRIGEHEREGSETAALSRAEQAGVAGAGRTTLDALAAANREYEARFGHIFLTAAAGRSAEEMLGELRRRLTRDPKTELRVAAAYQSAITRRRLTNLGETT